MSQSKPFSEDYDSVSFLGSALCTTESKRHHFGFTQAATDQTLDQIIGSAAGNLLGLPQHARTQQLHPIQARRLSEP